MNTPRVSREQAEMLKKVGYDVPTSKQEYIPYGEPFAGYETLFIPTLDEAARWLRDVKGWHVAVDVSRYYAFNTWLFEVLDLNGNQSYQTQELHPTHDLALSAGIDLILKKLEDGTQ